MISNFRHVLNVVCFLLGNSPAPEFYMPTFWNTLFHLHTRVGMENDRGWECWGICMGKGLARIAWTKPFPIQIPQHSQPRSFSIPTRLWRSNRQCSATLAYKIQTPGNYQEESIQQNLSKFFSGFFHSTMSSFQEKKN